VATFTRVTPDVSRLVADLVSGHYPDLAEAGATFYAEFARGPVDEHGELTGPALKDRGTPILGRVKVISLADRVAGLADVRLTLDGDEWPELTDGRREALLDTLLCALLVLTDAAGKAKRDDAGRPRIKVRPAEILVRGFYAVIDRHGEEAVEAEALQVAWDRCVEQGILQLRPVEPEVEPVPAGPRETLRDVARRLGVDLSWRQRPREAWSARGG